MHVAHCYQFPNARMDIWTLSVAGGVWAFVALPAARPTDKPIAPRRAGSTRARSGTSTTSLRRSSGRPPSSPSGAGGRPGSGRGGAAAALCSFVAPLHALWALHEHWVSSLSPVVAAYLRPVPIAYSHGLAKRPASCCSKDTSSPVEEQQHASPSHLAGAPRCAVLCSAPQAADLRVPGAHHALHRRRVQGGAPDLAGVGGGHRHRGGLHPHGTCGQAPQQVGARCACFARCAPAATKGLARSALRLAAHAGPAACPCCLLLERRCLLLGRRFGRRRRLAVWAAWCACHDGVSNTWLFAAPRPACRFNPRSLRRKRSKVRPSRESTQTFIARSSPRKTGNGHSE